jgi:hypothetical protein
MQPRHRHRHRHRQRHRRRGPVAPEPVGDARPWVPDRNRDITP